MSNLTIILTLKGRHLHTLRWLWHANRIRLPFHVIVADGEVHPTIDRLLSDPATFPNLRYEYYRYDDQSIKDYYSKIVDALEKAKTSYVMRSDNDDFLSPFGIEKSMTFLDSAPDYVCAGGGIAGFSLGAEQHGVAGVTGHLRSASYRYISNEWYRCRDIDNPSPTVRVLDEIRNPLSIHYSVYRTQALRTIAGEILACNPAFILCEMYSAMRATMFGKVKADPSHLTYFRQQGSSQYLGYSRDLVDDLLRSTLAHDFDAMASIIARDAAGSAGCDQSQFRDQIFDAYTDQIRLTLANTMLRHRFPRLFAMKQRLGALPRIRLVPPVLQRRLDLAKVWRQLTADGADSKTVTAHSAELAAIQETLEGHGFIKFVSRNASDLLALA